MATPKKTTVDVEGEPEILPPDPYAVWPTRKQAADMLGLSVSKVRRLENSGTLIAVKDITGTTKIDPISIQKSEPGLRTGEIDPDEGLPSEANTILEKALATSMRTNQELLGLIMGPLAAIEKDRAEENAALRQEVAELHKASRENMLEQQMLQLQSAKDAREAAVKEKALAMLSSHVPGLLQLAAQKMGAKAGAAPSAPAVDPDVIAKAMIADHLLAKMREMSDAKFAALAESIGGAEAAMLAELRKVTTPTDGKAAS